MIYLLYKYVVYKNYSSKPTINIFRIQTQNSDSLHPDRTKECRPDLDVLICIFIDSH